jgi:hypothetical protein
VKLATQMCPFHGLVERHQRKASQRRVIDKRRFGGRLSGGPPQSKDCYIGLYHAQLLCKANNLNVRFDVHLPPGRFGTGASVSAQPEQPATRAVGRLLCARHVLGCKSFGGIGFVRMCLLEFLLARARTAVR